MCRLLLESTYLNILSKIIIYWHSLDLSQEDSKHKIEYSIKAKRKIVNAELAQIILLLFF